MLEANAKPQNISSGSVLQPIQLKPNQAILLCAASEGDANMLYATGFFVPDPFIFFEHKNHRHIVMSDLEIDRAKKQAHADRVLSLSLYQKKLRKLGKAPAAMIDIVDLIFRERGIRSLIVPANFSALLLDQLRAKGYSVQIKRDPFWPQRETKNNLEVKQITESLRIARLGLEAGIRMLKRTKTKRDGYLYLNGTAADFRDAQDRGQYDDHGARLAAEPHDHLVGQSMRRSAP